MVVPMLPVKDLSINLRSVTHSMPLLLTLSGKALAQIWILSHVHNFSLLIQVNVGMERAESQLMLRLTLDTVPVRLGILAKPCPPLYLTPEYLFSFLLLPHKLKK